jgi:hypothetical protein
MWRTQSLFEQRVDTVRAPGSACPSPAKRSAWPCRFHRRLESTITLIGDRTKPEPALRFDTGRWVGQGAVLIHEGPELPRDVSLGGVVPHGNNYDSELLGGEPTYVEHLGRSCHLPGKDSTVK